MDFSLIQLLSVFLFSIPLGFTLGFVYEPFRLLHKSGFNKNVHFLITDIIFMSICGFVTFFFSLAFLEGSVRAFVILGEILGFVVYFKLITPITNKIYQPIIKFCKKIFGKLLKKGRIIMYNSKELLNRILGKLSDVAKKIFNRVEINEKRNRKSLSKRKSGEKHRRSKAKTKKAL